MGAFTPVKQFKVSPTGSSTPTAALSMEAAGLPIASNRFNRQARVIVKGGDAVIKFGDSAVAADNTVTASTTYADDNFVQAAGTVEVYNLRQDQTYVSMVSRDGTTAVEAYVNIGYGEYEDTK